jgi:predicted permease
MDHLIRELRLTIRNLARTPGFSALVILVMALGIGATAALFTVVNSVLLKPLALPDANRLVMASEADTVLKFTDNSVAGGTFESWRDRNHAFEQLAISTPADNNLATGDGQLPEHIETAVSTWAALPLLSVQPAYGRLFTASDDRYGANETTVLTWGLWKRRFGGDPKIVGHTILLDSKPFTVIGILPAWFAYPSPRTQLWTLVYPQATPQMMASHDSHNFNVIGKMKSGVSLAAATADLSNISAQERKQRPDGPVFNAAHVRSLVDADTYEIKSLLYELFAATGCLLLIACLNIANLLVARSASRRKESAIRTALGGSRGRLMRERVMESIVLSLAGAVFGILLAQLGLQWLVSLHTSLPRAETIHLDMAAVLFSVLLAMLCGIAAGLAPALAEDEQQVLRVLQESSRSVSGSQSSVRLRRALLAIEVALTVMLLVGAGLFLRSYQHLRSVNYGIPTDKILTMRISLPDASSQQGATPAALPVSSLHSLYDGPKKVVFYEQLLQQARALPGVRDAALSTVLPGEGHHNDDAITVHEHPPLAQGKWLDASTRWVDPGYFQSMKLLLLKGRSFAPDERLARNKYAIVSESFVKQFMPGEDPIGKHVDDSNNAQEGEKSASNEIIGVVGDVREYARRDPHPTVYYPLYGGLRGDVALAVRTASDPLNFALPVQRIVARLDANIPVSDILSLDQVIGKSTEQDSFNALLLTIFAVLSLLLAAVGLFGVLSYIVSQRTGEIGVRIALGAQRGDVLRLMLTDGLRPAIAGLVLGIVASMLAARLIRSLLFGISPLDPIVFVVVAAALLAVATVACLLPAWRASRLDPMQALRTE